MDIHVVTAGETLASIANQYNVDPDRLAQNNGIANPDNLVIGQTIVIQYPAQTHTVQEGQTLVSIANQYGISTIQLLQNNPNIVPRNYLITGETLVISYDDDKIGTVAINGYAYTFIQEETLLRTLPYLTYLSIFTYGFTRDGDLITTNDENMIKLAKDYQVAPIMVLSTLGPDGVFSNELARAIFENLDAQQNLINQILQNIQTKGYAGVDIDFEFIFAEDSDDFAQFVGRLRDALAPGGYIVTVALAPKTSDDQQGNIYQGHDYGLMADSATYILLMTYEWGYTYGPPMAVAPLPNVRTVLNYGLTKIPSEKIFMGVPNYGYDWPLPFVKGTTKARTIGNPEAVSIALENNVSIQYDETSQAPFFNYSTSEGIDHVVWFEDARSIDAKIRLVNELKLKGFTYWNLMKFFPQSWLVANSLYNIEKIQ